MYRTRPSAEHLTGFYLAMSVGGVTGGIFCALIAPALFDWTYEHPLLLIAAALLVPQHALFGALERLWSGPTKRVATTIVVAVLAVLAVFGLLALVAKGAEKL